MLVEHNDKRMKWVDVAKGIAMILTILGHTLSSENVLPDQIFRGAIYSFHMPLFFILSAYTFSFSCKNDEFVTKTEKAFKHLILPAVIVFSIKVLLNLPTDQTKAYIVSNLNTFLFASGVDVNVMGAQVPAMGMLWFLIVLFISRTVFDYMQFKFSENALPFIVLSCSAFGMIVSYIQWLPFSLDIAFAIIPFFLFGKRLKKVDIYNRPLLKLLLSTTIWAAFMIAFYYFFANYLELACRRYPGWFLSFVPAIAGSLMIMYSGVLIERVNSLTVLLSFIGRNSFYLYCVHALDGFIINVWTVSDNVFITWLIRLGVDLLIMSLISILVNKYKTHSTTRM